MSARPAQPSFIELFTPKLVTILGEGYGARELKADVIAGLTVAIVALPLSMAIAIASGLTPDRGLYAAIVGGFFVSALGGSRFQIGGPAGAFIVLVAATVDQHGVDAAERAHPARRGPAEAGHLHQVHSLSGDRRVHVRHRRHHLREPD
jgi:SulP family sulfate permease